jgi:phosphoribosyl 1,2-cyclic phosphodiesterase
LPAPLTAAQVRAKILAALEAARGLTLPAAASELAALADEYLPFHTRATYGGNTPCVQISTEGPDYVLLDGGTGLRDFAQHYRRQHTHGSRPSFPVNTTFHVLLSHFHWDHVQGLPFFFPLYLPGQRIIFYGTEKTEEHVRQQFFVPSFPVPYEALRAQIVYRTIAPGEVFDVAGLQVRTIQQNHPGGSLGYRFEHDGRVFVYSTDCEHKQGNVHAPDYPFLEFFADADLLVFDAMYSLDDATYAKADWGHSSNVMGVELAARARVQRLALFHHDPLHDDAELTEILFNTRMYAEMFHQEQGRKLHLPRKYPSEVLMAYDGLEVEL